ncbi:MAG: hypothetical protein QY328_15710 [Anaerolineales bacterium]|nr:MAG: hypothetical protein QY328_15710 [Anaerolineales bacterium]
MEVRPQTAFSLLFFVQHFFLLSSFIIASCASPTPNVPAETITAYATDSAQPWMSELFACANEKNILVEVTAENPDISLRIGESEGFVSPAFQIDEEEILVVVNRESSIQNLTLEEVQALFAGQGDESVQVWAYASGLDLQMMFDQFVMKGRSVTSFARLASNPQEMSDVLGSESDAIGFLPKRWMMGSIREVYSVGIFPILAITKNEPLGAVSQLIGCLQK